MNRRSFIKGSSLAGASLSLSPLHAQSIQSSGVNSPRRSKITNNYLFFDIHQQGIVNPT